MSTDVLGYLSEKSLAVKRAPGNEVHVNCIFCQEPDGKRGRLYINVDPEAEIPGLFECKLCGARGALPTIKKHFGDYTREQEEKDDSYLRRAILAEAARFYHENLDSAGELWLAKRGLSEATIRKHQLGFANGGLFAHLRQLEFRVSDIIATGLISEDKKTNRMRDFFFNHITVPYQVSGNVVMIRGRDLTEGTERKYVTPFGQKTRLFNTDAVWHAEEVVLTEGEFDCLILEQLGYNAVGVPGANTWQDSFDGYFADARRVYVVLDNDDAGHRGTAKITDHLGSKCRSVQMPEIEVDPLDPDNTKKKKNDITEWVANQGHTADDFDKLLRRSSGGLLVSVAEAIHEHGELQGQVGLKFGLQSFDLLIEPGLLPSQLMIPLAKTGTGKGHPLGTVVPTPSGWRKWGDLVEGDQVFGSDGSPTTVTAVYERGILPTYRVTFSDHTFIEVDGDHIHQVMFRFGHERAWTPTTRTTRELIEAGLRHGAEYRWRVPLALPVEYPEQDLPVGPYTMGALLANGGLTGTTAILTTPDEDVVARVAEEHEIHRHRPFDGCPRYGVNAVIGSLRAMGVAVKSADKHIPEMYLLGSIAQRWALLNGLMDGDGSVRHTRRAVLYHTTSQALAEGVTELVNSLGGTAVVRHAQREGYVEYTVSIMLDGAFSSERKSVTSPMRYDTHARRVIVGIEQIEDQEIRCISVAAADHLYLVGRSYQVTHNTIWLINMFYRLCIKQPEAKILFISLEQTRGDWWERARRIYRFFNMGASDKEAEDFWSERIMIVDRNRLTEEQLIQCIDDFSYEWGKPAAVGLDYLGYYAQSYRGERYEKTSDAVMGLKAVAKEVRVPIIAPHQVSRMTTHGSEPTIDNARDSGVVEETADFMLLLWSEDTLHGKELSQRTGEFMNKIGKSRHGGVGHKEKMYFAPLSLALVPAADDKHAAWARNELHYQAAYKETWQQALVRHEAGLPKDVVEFAKVEQHFNRKRQGVMS